MLDTTTFDDDAEYPCAFCGEANGIDVDLTAGYRQRYVEDCQVCCRPNVLFVSFDASGQVSVSAEPES